MKLFLIRHGETRWNKEKRFMGWETKISLNRKGKQQAMSTANKLATYPNIASVYTSPLTRAKKTAEIIAKRLDLPLRKSSFLNDWNMGIWTGVTEQQIKNNFYQKWHEYINKPTKFKIEKGESLVQLKARLIKGLRTIVETNKRKKDIIIVSHADPIKIIVGVYLKMNLDWIHSIQIAHCSITLIQITPSLLLEMLNDASHLKQIR